MGRQEAVGSASKCDGGKSTARIARSAAPFHLCEAFTRKGGTGVAGAVPSDLIHGACFGAILCTSPPAAYVTRQQLKDLAALARSRARREHGRFLVEGLRSVEAAVQASAPLEAVLVTAEAADDPRLGRLVAQTDAEVHTIAARDLERIGDARTSQGVLAVARSVVRDDLDSLEAPLLLLDGVQDPGNVGALVRTAAWFGIRTVVGDTATADFESPKAVRASMGGIWDVALARVPSLVPVLDRLAEAGVGAWGADLGGTSVGEWGPGASAALVMGSEAHGLSPEVSDWLRRQPPVGSRFVFIPGVEGGQPRGVESLNVAVAGAVLMSRWLG